MRNVYEVISTNVSTGSTESEYFDSERAANRWKEMKESRGLFVSEVVRWRVWSYKDI